MPSIHSRFAAGLALASLTLGGLAAPAQADHPPPAEITPSLTAAEPAAPETPLNRGVVEDIVRRTLSATCCQDCCCPPPPCYCWEGAVEVTFLQPRFDIFGNGEVVSSFDLGNGQFTIDQEPQFDLEAGWRVWLGFAGPNGFGGRARYWHMDADSETVAGNLFDLETFSLGTSLEMDVVDIEGLFRRPCGLWLVQVGVGVRYARLERRGLFTENNLVTIGSESESFKRAFEGVGPTLALEGRRQIAGGLSGIVNTRASLLAGRTVDRVEEVYVGEAEPTTFFLDTSETDNSLFVVETQIGLEYARPMGAFEIFGRALLEAQYWFDGGRVIGAGSSTLFNGHDRISGEHQNLGLIGCALAAGFRR